MLRNLFCIFITGFWTVVAFIGTIVAMLVTLNRSASMWVVQRFWSPVLLWAGGAQLEVQGLEGLDRKRPYVFVSNHQSTIDIPALFVALPWNTRFVSKKALMYVPFLGWYMWLAKFIFVDRGNRKTAIASLDKAAQQIRDGISIIVFAEGTRSPDLTVKPFKKGPFALAMKAGVPIVPVAIEGSGKLMPKNRWVITPGPIKVLVGKPIDPQPFGDDREGLIAAVRSAIIDQNVALGGKGGDKRDAVAAQGLEGIGKAARGAQKS
ncbi:MAG: 1-acylglycerol-3-phosphate O-acyltransferase [Myxococcota bacterium]|jgi:1-acyl-sn-glycerol-3-phosphate acyltransferase